MDINFHYFAVRTMAEKAGFSSDEAQLLASYSQFVDDYDIRKPFRVTGVPDYAKHLTKDVPVFGTLFYPVTTGFNSWFDMALLITETSQKYIVTPFHFIPRRPLNVSVQSRADYRVVPELTGTDSVLWKLLESARNAFLQASHANRHICLIHIGTLCHTFADTYAHQNFSGLWDWENHCKLKKVTDNITKSDITKSYNPDAYHQLPSIGHTNANHAPDDSNVSYETAMRYSEKDDYTWRYQRSNTREFLTCSHRIFNYLRTCLGKQPLNETDPEWQIVHEGLRQGFLTPEKDASMLARHWKNIFPDIDYSYSKEPLLRNVFRINTDSANALGMNEEEILSTMLDPHNRDIVPVLFEVKSDDFYRYNVFAKTVRDAVNGCVTALLADPEIEMRLELLQSQA